MTERETLTALLRAVSRQSQPFQSLIYDYAADVMADPETHRLFSERLGADYAMQDEIARLKASLGADSGTLSPLMQDLLAAVDVNNANPREIADLAAVELVYELREIT